MKYKGRPQSRNIQDRRKAVVMQSVMTIDHIIQAADEERRGKASGGSKGKRTNSKYRTGGGF